MKDKLTQEKLKELLFYNPESGKFYHRKARGNKPAWSEAGVANNHGYILIQIDKIKCIGHRIAWLYMTGRWPDEFVDHIDGNRSNNSFSNLREATRSENVCNSKLSEANKSGVKGVFFHKKNKKWICTIRVNNERVYLGCYSFLQEAEKVVTDARNKLHGEFKNHG